MWSRALAILVGLAMSGLAHAGACCMGATSTMPARLGPCEKFMVGGSLSGEVAVARWNSDRSVAPVSTARQALNTTLGAGFRWDRKGQMALAVPVLVQHAKSDDGSAWGGGLGDISASVLWHPSDEKVGSEGHRTPPVPLLNFGLRVPTGRSWDQSKKPLAVDVTGLGDTGILVGLGIEKTMNRRPWSLMVQGDLGVNGEGVRPALTVSGSLGQYVGTRWSVSGLMAYQQRWSSSGGSTARTTVGARLVHGQRLKSRTWMGIDADVPIPGLGRSVDAQVRLVIGTALVR